MRRLRAGRAIAARWTPTRLSPSRNATLASTSARQPSDATTVAASTADDELVPVSGLDQVVVLGAVRVVQRRRSSRARGHRAVGEDDGARAEARLAGLRPRRSTRRRRAPRRSHAEVAADVHTHAIGTELDELGRHQVRREPLADAARIERDVERKADGALVVVDLDALRPRDDPQGRCRCNRDRVERPVVPGGDHRGKHGRIETATREPMAGERPAHQQAGVRRHGDWLSRGPVDAG